MSFRKVLLLFSKDDGPFESNGRRGYFLAFGYGLKGYLFWGYR